jgi:hypothetical protein
VRRLALLILCGAACGCGPNGCSTSPPPPQGGAGISGPGLSDPEQVRAADYSILFVGNSHTSMHDIPGLVAKMIRHRHPDKTVLTRTLGVGFLEDAAHSPEYREEIASRPWKRVVLQAQKISMSGKVEYSRAEGIDLAKAVKARGAEAVFYAEWGLRGVDGDGAKQEKVYLEMAAESGARVACVRRAWEKTLAERPDLPLYAGDGNHQAELGAFVTAAVLFGVLTGENPTTLADFPYPNTDAATRKLLTDAAAEAVAAK